MRNENVKRNDQGETAEHQQSTAPGVGGRHGSTAPSQGGGGYQDICSSSNFCSVPLKKIRDPRLDEFKEMGLQRVWLDVAEEIGVDAMLKIWRIIDSDQENVRRRLEDKGRLLVPVLSYGTYLRYQRNRLIETLSALGFRPAIIRERIHSQLGENVSRSLIFQLVRRFKTRKQ